MVNVCRSIARGSGNRSATGYCGEIERRENEMSADFQPYCQLKGTLKPACLGLVFQFVKELFETKGIRVTSSRQEIISEKIGRATFLLYVTYV